MKAEEYQTLRAQEDHHWWYATLHQQVIEALSEHSQQPLILLDAGCGTGGLLSQLRSHQTTGLDISPHAIAACHQRSLHPVYQASVHDIPCSDDQFDAVLSLDVLYHAEVDEKAALREMSRVLKPGGLLILNLPAHECLRGSHDEAVCGVRRYNSCHVEDWLRPFNLRVKMSYHWNAWLFPLLFCWRSWTRMRHHVRRSDLTMPPAWLNTLLKGISRLDAKLCRRFRSRVGSSLWVIAEKNQPV